MTSIPSLSQEIHSTTSSARKKPGPARNKTPLPFAYTGSTDGTDGNLLILFHGFGDTHVPFTKLGRSLNLPQTATLAICGPTPIPFLEEDDPEAYQWYPTYDELGELLTNPNPSSTLQSLVALLELLIAECSWQSSRIHLFGFAQGGSVAVELALHWSRLKGTNLGSVITVAGPLLSYPTVSSCTTPILVIHRPGSNDSALKPIDLIAIRKGFTGRVIEEKLGGKKEGMPAGRDEWEPLMRFWSESLSRRAPEGTVEISRRGPNADCD